LHYAPNDNFNKYGRFTPGADGFNLADIPSYAKDQMDALPAGVLGLVWLGTCAGATASFKATVDAFAGDPKLYGFYVDDEPIPWRCPARNLLAENNYIHARVPGAKTFAILENLGPMEFPDYTGTYTPQDSGFDLIGIDPYPVRPSLGPPHYMAIEQYVKGAESIGWPASSIVPVYQTFGRNFPTKSNGNWSLPSTAEERQMLADWAAIIPHPAFDYAYGWGAQPGDTALALSPPLQAIFAEKQKSSINSTGPPASALAGYAEPDQASATMVFASLQWLPGESESALTRLSYERESARVREEEQYERPFAR
jgi:hypothetical protein